MSTRAQEVDPTLDDELVKSQNGTAYDCLKPISKFDGRSSPLKSLGETPALEEILHPAVS